MPITIKIALLFVFLFFCNPPQFALNLKRYGQTFKRKKRPSFRPLSRANFSSLNFGIRPQKICMKWTERARDLRFVLLPSRQYVFVFAFKYTFFVLVLLCSATTCKFTLFCLLILISVRFYLTQFQFAFTSKYRFSTVFILIPLFF